MRVRSPRLLVASLFLLMAAGGLAFVLQHDGELDAAPERLSSAERGEDVLIKAELRHLDRAERQQVTAVASPVLQNHTYVALDEDGLLVLATHGSPLATDTSLVMEGKVALRTVRDDGLLFVVVRVQAAEEPLLFR